MDKSDHAASVPQTRPHAAPQEESMPITPQKWLGEIAASTITAGIQTRPDIAGLQDGGFVAVWDGGAAVAMQRFDALGNKVGGEVVVNSTSSNAQAGSSVTVLTDGSYVVAWTDASLTAPDTLVAAVRARHFNADGTPKGGDFVVNTTIAGSQNTPAISALPGGGYVVSWNDSSATGGDVSGTA